MMVALIDDSISTARFLAIDTETTGLSIKHGCRVFAVSTCNSNDDVHYWETDVDPRNRKPQWDRASLEKILTHILSYKVLVFFNITFDIKALMFMFKEYDDLLEKFVKHILGCTLHDVAVMAHIFDSKGPNKLKELSVLHLEMLDDDEKALDALIKKLHFKAKELKWDYAQRGHKHFPGAKKNWHKMDMWMARAYAKKAKLPKTEPHWTICGVYAKKDAIRTAGLFYVFANHINKTTEDVKAYRLQQSIYLPLMDIELTGIHLLPQKFHPQIEEYEEQASKFRHTLCSIAHVHDMDDFNPDSGIQLQEMLFDRLGFEPTKLTKTGFSTDKTVLPKLLDQPNTLQARRFVSSLLHYRATYSALKYLRSYDQFKLNDRLYPNLNQTGTSTTRLSSSDPNGQNIGKGKELEDQFDEDGNKILAYSLRRVFGPPPGYFWVSIDYDQLQIRIFAYLSQDPILIRAIEEGQDFHNLVACAIYKTKNPSKEQRKRAKYVNFGLLFGAGPNKIDLLAGFSGAYDRFSRVFPHATDYLLKRANDARKNGYIRTAGGYPLTVFKNRAYTAVNYEVQGTEGEIVKRSLAKCSNLLKINTSESIINTLNDIASPNGKILIQIHDEFIFEFKKGSSVPLRKLIKAMESSGDEFGVPCKCKPELIKDDWSSPKAIPIDYFERKNGLKKAV